MSVAPQRGKGTQGRPQKSLLGVFQMFLVSPLGATSSSSLLLAMASTPVAMAST